MGKNLHFTHGTALPYSNWNNNKNSYNDNNNNNNHNHHNKLIIVKVILTRMW